MATLLRHACRQTRLLWRQQPQQQQDVAASLNAIDNALLPSIASTRSLTFSCHRNEGRFSNPPQASILNDDSIMDQLDIDKRLNISHSKTTPTAVRLEPLVLTLFVDPKVNTQLYLKSSQSSIGPVVGPSPTTIAPPLPSSEVKNIIEPTKGVPIVISDKRSGEKVIVGDQPSPNAVVEIIGDRMDNLVKKEAIRILQIKRTKMNRHKLLKWRKKFKHMIKARIERKENSEKMRLDRSLEGIHKEAEAFNPVTKVSHHVELAKNMGYKVSFYKEMPLTKWLEEKEKQDGDNEIRFEDRNRERYRKLPPWDYEKF